MTPGCLLLLLTIYNMNNQSSFKYLTHKRFNAIYQLSKLDRPSWEIIGEVVLDEPITSEEFLFVLSKTRKEDFQ